MHELTVNSLMEDSRERQKCNYKEKKHFQKIPETKKISDKFIRQRLDSVRKLTDPQVRNLHS